MGFGLGVPAESAGESFSCSGAPEFLSVWSTPHSNCDQVVFPESLPTATPS